MLLPPPLPLPLEFDLSVARYAGVYSTLHIAFRSETDWVIALLSAGRGVSRRGSFPEMTPGFFAEEPSAASTPYSTVSPEGEAVTLWRFPERSALKRRSNRASSI